MDLLDAAKAPLAPEPRCLGTPARKNERIYGYRYRYV